MPFTDQIYSPGQKLHPSQDRDRPSKKFDRYKYARVGTILNVDYDRYEMSVQWAGSGGARDTIPITFPYMGPAGFIGCLPEKYAIGVFVFGDETDTGWGTTPKLVAYLPSGLANAINHANVQLMPDSLAPGDDANLIRFSHRRMREGDMQFASPRGSTMFLNQNVELHDDAHDTILLRKGDRAILNTSRSHYVFADGALVVNGPAVRNALVLFGPDGKPVKDINAVSMSMPDLKDVVWVSPGGTSNAPGLGTRYYPEHRVEVEDYGDGKLPQNDVNANILGMTDPVVIMTLGNYIGSDRRDADRYGKPLRATVFKNFDDREGDFNLGLARQANGVDEPSVYGLAWGMHFPKSGAFLGIDKQGHWNVNLAMLKGGPLSGHSMSMLAPGSLKESWGREKQYGNSWNMTARGGVIWDVGAHNGDRSGSGIEINTDGSWLLNAGTDSDGTSKAEILTGQVVTSIGGDYQVGARSVTYNIRGMLSENVAGAFSGTYQADLSMNVSGVFTETVMKEKQNKFGKRKTSVTVGNDELTVLAGNIQSEVTLGSIKNKVTTGSMSNEVLLGNIKTKITTGNLAQEVLLGGVEIKNKLVEMAMDVAGRALMKGKLMATIEGAITKVGKNAPIGGGISGLPGKPSHYDFVTGAPHKGSNTVGIA